MILMKKPYRMIMTACAVAAGFAAGVYVVSKTELGVSIKGKLNQLNPVSRDAMDMVSEEVALRTAKVTRNPQINQSWVEKQWEQVGY